MELAYNLSPKGAHMIGSDKRTRVLIVDDNPGIARFLRINLEKAGYSVVVVLDLKMAHKISSALPFGAVALDSSVPELSTEAVTALRNELECTVLIYGLGIEADYLGADGWLERFYEPDALPAAISAAISKNFEKY